jgi:hypothetical protein
VLRRPIGAVEHGNGRLVVGYDRTIQRNDDAAVALIRIIFTVVAAPNTSDVLP